MAQLSFKKKYIPNYITIFRIILVIPIIVLLLIDNFSFSYNYKIDNVIFNISWNQVIVGILFIIASVSDFLDGYLSRKFNWVTNFGKFWDPLADKILVNTTLILLSYKNFTYVAFVILFIARDIIIDGLRMINAKKNIVISAAWSGKVKTFIQMIAICLLLFIGSSNQTVYWWYWGILNLLIYLALFFSLYSLGEYCLKYFKYQKNINKFKLS